MAIVLHVTSGLGLRKFQTDGFLLTRVYNGYQVISGRKRPGRGVEHPPPLALRLKKGRAVPVLILCAILAGYRVNFAFLCNNTWTHTFQAVEVILFFVYIRVASCSWATAAKWAEAWHRSPVSSSEVMNEWSCTSASSHATISGTSTYCVADKSLARPGRKQATATKDFHFRISYL